MGRDKNMKVKKTAGLRAIAFAAAGIIAVLASGPAWAKAPECVKDGKKYGVVEGNFREEWYSYQERADSYLEGGCHDAALADYSRAVELRQGVDRAAEIPGCDKRRARTYGMHFEDWFGHRGKGVSLFELGRIDESIPELELSLQCTESSQAQYYLDKARAQKLKTGGGDSRAPSVKKVILVTGEPRVDFVREGTPAAAAGYDRFVAVPYYYTLADIEAIVENLDKQQKKDKAFMKSLKPGWGSQTISWKSSDEVTGPFVKEGKLYLIVESEDDQGVQYVEASGIRSPYTFAQKTRADVFPIEIATPVLDEPINDPAFMVTEDLFSVPIDETQDQVVIKLKITDLAGKAADQDLIVKIDRDGPQVTIESAKIGPSGKEAIIKGIIEDAAGVKGFDFGGATPKSLGDGRFEVTAPLSADQKVKFSAIDRLGNSTSGAVSLETIKKGTMLELPVHWARWASRTYESASREVREAAWAYLPPPSTSPHQAWMPLDGTMIAQNEINLSEGGVKGVPSIQLKTKDTTVYTNQIYIEGSAQGMGANLTAITINGKKVLKKPKSNAFFNKLIYLRPGKNLIRVKASDEAGQVTEEKFVVNRIVPRVNSVAERLAVSMLPLYQDPSFVEIGEVAGDNLATSLVQQRRFRYVDRSKVDAAVRELRLSGTGLVDPATAVRAGKMTNAEAIIIGVIRETPTSIELQTQIVDVETARVMITRDAFHQDKSLENLNFISKGLAVKIKNAFPIVQGNVASAGKTMTVSLGSRNRVMPGMMVVFFKIIPKTDASGQPVGADTEKVAEGKVMAVSSSSSTVQITKSSGSVQAQDLVVTK